jgi:hypothetical protein
MSQRQGEIPAFGKSLEILNRGQGIQFERTVRVMSFLLGSLFGM